MDSIQGGGLMRFKSDSLYCWLPLEDTFVPACEGNWETPVLSNSYPEPKQQDGCSSMTLAWLESRWPEGSTPWVTATQNRNNRVGAFSAPLK